MIISHKYKIIFIHICKNAGTFITYFLKNLDENIEYLGDYHNNCKYGKEVLDPEIWNNYTKFCVIRNSWDFTLSLYTYIKLCEDHHLYNLVKNLSFEEYLLSDDIDICITRNLSQTYFIMDDYDNIMVDYMINFDCLNTSLVHFFKEIIKIDLETIMEALPRNKINKSDKEYNYKLYYNNKTIELVSKIHEKDIVFLNFKYDVELTDDKIKNDDVIVETDDKIKNDNIVKAIDIISQEYYKNI